MNIPVATGGYKSDELARCQFGQNVIRILVNSDGTKTAELYSHFRKTWKPIDRAGAGLLVDVFGVRALEFLDTHKIL